MTQERLLRVQFESPAPFCACVHGWTLSSKWEATGQRRIDSHELYYMAGYFDGEGCIQWNNTVSVSISSAYPVPFAVFVRHFGGSVRSKGRPERGMKQAYHWRIHGKAARIFCATMYPFLIEKKAQAILVLKIGETPRSERGPLVKQLRQLKRISYHDAAESLERINETRSD